MKRSIMLTGAPVTGKSTITRSLRNEHEFIAAPDYTTRVIRPDEVNALDKKFVSTPEFIALYNNDRIIEPTLDFCNYQGNYYGTPVEWLDARELGKQKILTCVAVQIADTIRRNNPDLVWVHLRAEPAERADRLALRGISDAEVAARMANIGGDSLSRPANADMIINTSRIALDATVQLILEATS